MTYIEQEPKSLREKAAQSIFAVSFFIGLIFFTMVVWADFESLFFDNLFKGEKVINAIRCPLAITNTGSEFVKVSVYNEYDEPNVRRFRSLITQGALSFIRDTTTDIEIPAKSWGEASWEVFPTDVAHDRYIWVKLYLYADYPIRAQHASCGILYLNTDLVTGTQATYLLFGVSAAGMLFSIFLMDFGRKKVNDPQAALRPRVTMPILAALVLSGLVFNFYGGWLTSVGLLLVAIVMAVSVVSNTYLQK